MKKFIKNNCLIIILAVAFSARIIGIFYAYPLVLGSDETPALLASLKMIGTHSLKITASSLYYPPVLAYIYLPFFIIFLLIGKLVGIFSNTNYLKELVLLNIGVFLPLARLISVFFGTASVYLIFKISQKIFNNLRLSIIASLLLAFSFFHVGVSQFANTWPTQTFFILLVLFWSVNLLKKNNARSKDYFWGGIFIGLAFGINVVGIISYYWLVVAHFLKNKNKSFFQTFIKNYNFWLANLVIVLMILINYYLNPFGLNNYFNRLTDTASPAVFGGNAVYKIFHFSTLQTLFFYLKNTFILEPWLFILTIISSFFLWKKNKTAFFLIIIWIIIYFLLLAPLTGPIHRYALPVIPLLTIAVSYLINELFKKKIFAYSLLIIMTAYSLIFIILFDLRMLKNDTRLLARNWVIKNVPSDSIIKNNNLNESLALIESRENIEFIEKYFPEMMSTKRKYLLNLNNEDYPRPNYFLIMYDYDKRIDLNLKSEYIILASFDKSQLEKMSQDFFSNYYKINYFYPVNNNYSFWPDNRDLEIPFNDREFFPWSLFRQFPDYGPYIEIYKIKANLI